MRWTWGNACAILCPMSFRPQKMASLIRETVASFLRGIPQQEYGIISITEVEVSSDLQYATIFVSTLKNPEGALQLLKKNEHEIMGLLQKSLTTYRIPSLRYKIDDRGERGERIDKLLNDSSPQNSRGSTQGKGA